MEVVGEASNGAEAIKQAKNLYPDLIIMDISMPVLDGLNAAEIVKKHHPETRILLFSMHNVPELIERAKHLGLNGYVPKEEGVPSLLDAVNAVRHNQTYFPD
jgi:two-component system nitrate/nitrite response regulator NarL